MSSDGPALPNLACPLCDATGSLVAIEPKRRLKAGLISFALSVGKSFECRRCGAMFTTEQLLKAKARAS